jgi:hypothetical protein
MPDSPPGDGIRSLVPLYGEALSRLYGSFLRDRKVGGKLVGGAEQLCNLAGTGGRPIRKSQHLFEAFAVLSLQPAQLGNPQFECVQLARLVVEVGRSRRQVQL